MADIFNEIDEELRQEKIRRLWDRYGILLLVLAVAIVAGVAGWRYYDNWRAHEAQAQGDAFVAAGRLAASGDVKGAEAGFAALAAKSSGGYPALAALRTAALKAEAGDTAAALAGFDAVAAAGSTPPLLAEVARIRAAYLAVDLEERAALETRVGPLAAAGRPFRGQAREIMALAAWKAGDVAATSKWVDDIESDGDSPRDLLERTAMLSALVKAQATSGKVN